MEYIGLLDCGRVPPFILRWSSFQVKHLVSRRVVTRCLKYSECFFGRYENGRVKTTCFGSTVDGSGREKFGCSSGKDKIAVKKKWASPIFPLKKKGSFGNRGVYCFSRVSGDWEHSMFFGVEFTSPVTSWRVVPSSGVPTLH